MADRCSVEGCDRPSKIKARQLCNLHYLRLQRTGLTPIVVDYFWPKVDVRGPDECWEWKGYRNRDGYGSYSGKTAHRVAFEKTTGILSGPGFHVDHRCRNHGCCNPAHLRLRDAVDNVRDTIYSSRMECGRGHAYTTENTRVVMRDGRPRRCCRACDRIRQAKSKAKRMSS